MHRLHEHALREQIARARQGVSDSGTDPGAHLALARAIVEYHEKTGQGRLAEAVSSARRAAKLSPNAHEALLWEGIAHARSGRAKQARDCLLRFQNVWQVERGSLSAKARQYLDGS
jgi:Flp pilus assembly protein TadD